MATNFDVVLNGLGLNDFGLYGKSVSGLGLNTFGFIWGCADIWNATYDTPTTTWTDCPTYNSSNLEVCSE